MNKKEKWAKNFDKCVMCHTTKKPHRQYGYCVTCWSRVRYRRERDKFRKWARDYYYRNRDKILAKQKKKNKKKNTKIK